MDLFIENRGNAPITQAAVQFNQNYIGAASGGPVQLASPISPGGRGTGALLLRDDGPMVEKGRPGTVQMAIKYDVERSAFAHGLLNTPHSRRLMKFFHSHNLEVQFKANGFEDNFGFADVEEFTEADLNAAKAHLNPR